jgi:DMSO reductase anchor subunit
MNKRAEWMSDRTADVLVTVYFFLAGIYTLNFLGNSIAAHVSGIAFLIASVYGVVSVFKGTKLLA